MREYEIYLPGKRADGSLVSASELERFKAELAEVFGGYTHLNQTSEGAWKMGGVTFYDDVTILRVLDDGSADFDWKAFRKRLETSLQQEQVLVIEREVRVV